MSPCEKTISRCNPNGAHPLLQSPHVEKSHDSNHTSIATANNKRVIFFRIGPLRFGFHGIFGIISTFVVSYSLFKSYTGASIPFWLGLGAVVTSTINAVGSYGLLPQVPNTSHITSWIFPPHKEAFKRTIAIVGYLNIRLVHEWQWILGNESIVFPLLLFSYTTYHFFPRQRDYFNGNTWVFVFPMFIGFNIDTFMQFPSMEWRRIISSPATFLTDAKWHDVHSWNQNRIDETYLLLTLLCALQIAFMFTIAFRGRMSIQVCYWIAAAEVGLLCVRLIRI